MTMTVPPGQSSSVRMAAASGPSLPRTFPRISLVLHWLLASLILAMFVSGVMMKQIAEGAIADQLYNFHKTCGVSILVLVVVRLVYRGVAHLAGRWTPGSGSHPIHAVLYLVMIAVPLLGWAGISDFGARTVYFGLSLPAIWPEGAGYDGRLFESHAVLAFALVACVAIHIGVALGDYIERGGNRESFPAEPAKTASPAASDMP